MSRDRHSDLLFDNGLPSNTDAEKRIIGGLIALFEAAHFEAAERLDFVRARIADGRFFSLESNRIIWKAMCDLQDQQMHPDAVAITTHLDCQGLLVRAGGVTCVSDLSAGVPFPDEKTLDSTLRLLAPPAAARELLRETEYVQAKIADGDDPWQVGRDLAARVAEILELRTGGQHLRPIFHADERKQHIRPARQIVKGVVYRRQVTLIVGLGGVGKSQIVTDIAATASQFLRVLLIINESPEEYDPRLDTWCALHGLGLPGLHLLTQRAGLFDPAQVKSLISSAAEAGGFDLIVLDVLSNEYDGREETNENATAALNQAKQIMEALDCGMILTGHTGWAGSHIRGGSSSEFAARNVFLVENNDGLICIKATKANVSREFAERRFRILQLPIEQIRDGDPSRAEEYTVIVPANRVALELGPLTRRQREVLRALALPVFATTGARLIDLVDHLHLAKSTVNDVSSALMKRGLVDRKKSGQFLLTQKGWELSKSLDSDTQETQPNQETELRSNSSPFNWTIEVEDGSDISSVVRDGSPPAQTQFGGDCSAVRSRSLSLESELTELNEPNQGQPTTLWRS